MDMATSMAIWVRLGRFRHQATLDLRVDYLRPATPGGRILGRGECYRITRSVAFVRGECYRITRSVAFVRGTAHDGDPADPVAHVTGTFIFTD
jgi:acyl-coenzyme A thioesterase PaaI-like protein